MCIGPKFEFRFFKVYVTDPWRLARCSVHEGFGDGGTAVSVLSIADSAKVSTRV